MSEDWPFEEVDCPDCQGTGSIADRNPNDPAMRLIACFGCEGAGFVLRQVDPMEESNDD